jgi:hypothetical protein
MEINKRKFVKQCKLKTSNKLLSNGEIWEIIPPEKKLQIVLKMNQVMFC